MSLYVVAQAQVVSMVNIPCRQLVAAIENTCAGTTLMTLNNVPLLPCQIGLSQQLSTIFDQTKL